MGVKPWKTLSSALACHRNHGRFVKKKHLPTEEYFHSKLTKENTLIREGIVASPYTIKRQNLKDVVLSAIASS